MADESYGMKPLSNRKRSGGFVTVGGQDYSGMTEGDVREQRLARIKKIFAGLKKPVKQVKPVKPGKPPAPARDAAEEAVFTEDLPEFDMGPIPAVGGPSGFLGSPQAARGLADMAAISAYAANPSIGPEGLDFLHTMVDVGAPMVAGPLSASGVDASTRGVDIATKALERAVNSPHGMGMVRPDVWASEAVQAAAPYIPGILQAVTAPGSISSSMPGRVSRAMGESGPGYNNVMDVLARMFRGN